MDGTENTKTLFKNLLKQFFENADMAKAYPNLFKLLWFSNIPCFKKNVTSSYLLKKCLWQGKEHDCKDLFRQIPTDSGNPGEFLIFVLISFGRHVLCLQFKISS